MTLTSEEALRVARFCWPKSAHYWSPTNNDSVAHAERVLVERGLAHEYGQRLAVELGPPPESLEGYFGYVAMIRTAPTEVIARAVLRVVDEQTSKEKA